LSATPPRDHHLDRVVRALRLPESHAASFALLAYASAYLKAHFPAAFYTALLNNQPMGFYHPATLVKDAQRRGVRFHPIDVQISGWTAPSKPTAPSASASAM
jgi:error-prone DNA polymerase